MAVSWVAMVTLLLQLTTVASCPVNCTCQRENTNCRNASLTSVPANLTDVAIVIDISFNNISVVHNTDFVNLTHLDILFLNNNGVLKVEPLAFRQTKGLLHLYLNDNKIYELIFSVFYFATKLRYLYLQNNAIQSIDSQLFKHNSNLLMLDISGNKIHKLETKAFQYNPILSWVNVRNNPLTLPLEWKTLLNGSLNVLEIDFCEEPGSYLGAFQNVPSLRLTESKRHSVLTLDEFTSFQRISELDMNEIEYLKYKTFHDIYSLSYGAIRNVKIAENLNVVTLAGDTVMCYCGNHSFWFWCSEPSQTSCSKIMTKPERYKFLGCDAQLSGVIYVPDDGNKTISDVGKGRRLFWPFYRPISWKNIRNTLLYASVPGCIIILVVGAYIVKLVKRRRANNETGNSHVYSELKNMSIQT